MLAPDYIQVYWMAVLQGVKIWRRIPRDHGGDMVDLSCWLNTSGILIQLWFKLKGFSLQYNHWLMFYLELRRCIVTRRWRSVVPSRSVIRSDVGGRRPSLPNSGLSFQPSHVLTISILLHEYSTSLLHLQAVHSCGLNAFCSWLYLQSIQL